MRLSLIVPVYNGEAFLSECLESLRKQRIEDMEIIVIDDGSTDSSLKTARSFEELDQRFHVYTKTNEGVSMARNLGLSYAKGDYVSFLDADDSIDEGAYETLLEKINGHEALFFGYRESYRDQDHLRIIEPEKTGIVNGEEALYQCFLPIGVGYFTSVWNKIFKRELVKDVLFDKELKIGEDELWLTQVMKKIDDVVLVNTAYYNYVQLKSSALHSEYALNAKWRSAIQAKKEAMKLLDKDSKIYPLFCAKFYDDLFQLSWFTYINNDEEGQRYIKAVLDPFKKDFYASEMHSRKKKLRYALISKMIEMHMPKKLVKVAGEARSYHVKMFFSKMK